ncbi:hypothetical protein N7481_011434 [Penicillium waksmanii]|uniref:uncharacterized protein n=1 Tax=Penicillium waksmanii TaxID=69791 RepID=UPI00254949BD|nr:uncharacterized protein N7481_011434 [Penicillium waksmanii]KAJ5974224.1 hypothetical protein N7481_011434 [Penicillium waksmanii]
MPTPPSLHDTQFRQPVAFTKNRNRWGSAVSSRWGFFIFFWILAIMIYILLLVLSIVGITGGGFGQLGAISYDTILSVENSGESLVTTSLIANLPQLIFSFLCVTYNSLLTSMCLST